MRVKFFGNLGSMDAAAIKQKLHVDVNYRECVGSRAGTEVDIPDEAYAWLKAKYPGLLEEVKQPAKYETAAHGYADVKGVAPKAAVAETKDTSIKAK